jgi:hypothetical protein
MAFCTNPELRVQYVRLAYNIGLSAAGLARSMPNDDALVFVWSRQNSALFQHHISFDQAMAFAANAGRLIGVYTLLCGEECSNVRTVPLGIAAALAQASIYDVPGGYRAVMFDRFAGVKDQVHPPK